LNAPRLIRELLQAGITVSVQGEQLRADGATDKLTDYGKATCKELKPFMIWHLENDFQCMRDGLTFAELRELNAAYHPLNAMCDVAPLAAYQKQKHEDDGQCKHAQVELEK